MGIIDSIQSFFQPNVSPSVAAQANASFNSHAAASAFVAPKQASSSTPAASSPSRGLASAPSLGTLLSGKTSPHTASSHGSTPASAGSKFNFNFSAIDDPNSAANKSLITIGGKLGSVGSSALSTLRGVVPAINGAINEAAKLKAAPTVTNPTKIVTVEMPTTGNAKKDKILSDYQSTVTDICTQSWIEKYTGQDLDKSMTDLKKQIDQAPNSTNNDLVERAKLIAEYQFLEAAKNYGIYMDYDLQGGYNKVAAMDRQIEELESKMRRYTDAQSGNYSENWLVDEDRDAGVVKAAGITESEYEQMRADHAALEEYRAALKREVDDAKRVQLGSIYASMAADPTFEELAKKGAAASGNERVENPNGLLSYMTEDEQKMYDVIFAAGTKKDVDTYVEYLEPTLIQRRGLGRAEKVDQFFGDSWAGNAAQTYATAGLGFANALVDSTVDTGLGAWGGLTGHKPERDLNSWDYTVGALRNKTAEMGGKDGKNIGTVLIDSATSSGRMAPMLLSAALLKWAGAPQAAVKLIPGAVMSTGIYSSVKDEMTRMGYNEKSASTYAALSAASETAVGAAIGGFEEIGGVMNIPGVQELIGNIDNAFLRYAVTMGVKMHAEGREEYIQDVIDPLFQDLAFGGHHEFNIISEEGAYSYLVAAMSVFGSEGIQTYSSVTQVEAMGAYVDAVRQANPELYNNLIDSAINSGNEEISELAQNIKDGKYKDNNGNLGQLLDMMARTGAKSGRWSDVKQAAETFIKLSSMDLASLKFGAIQSDARAAAQAEWDRLVAANPDKVVLDPIASELAAKTGWDIETVKEQGTIISKIVSGVIPTKAEVAKLDVGNKFVQEILERYSGKPIDASMDRASLWLDMVTIATNAAETEMYQAELKKANEAFLNQRTGSLEALGQNPETLAKLTQAAAEAEKGTDLQIGKASFSKKKNQPFTIPAADTNTSGAMDHDQFVEAYIKEHGVSRDEAEAAWNRNAAVNSALNGGDANGQQVRGTAEGRVGDVAGREGASEVHGRDVRSGSAADAGGTETDRRNPAADAGARVQGPVIAEADYTPEQRQFVEDCKRDGFQEVDLVDGPLFNDAGQRVNAKTLGKKLVISTLGVDGKTNDPAFVTCVGKHEKLHLWLDALGLDRGKTVRRLVEAILPNERIRQAIYEKYVNAYTRAYSHLSGVELADAIYEEILCDMFGGINFRGSNANNYQEVASRMIAQEGFREQYLKNGPAKTQQTSQVETTATEQTTQETATETGPPETTAAEQETATETGPPADTIEDRVRRDMGEDEDSRPDLADLLNEADYDGEYNPSFDEYYSVAEQDKAIRESLPRETQQALDENGLTIQNGVIVSNENAELMRNEGYQKPQTWDEQYSIATEPQWEESYRAQGGDPAVADTVKRITDWMIANEAVYNYLPHGEYASSKFGPLRPNMEYIVTFDMDTSCPRTFQYIHIRDMLQRYAKRPLTFNESINLLNIMKQTNQMIPCTYCYVENKRILKSSQYLNYYAARDGVMSAKDAASAKKLMYSYNPKKGTLGKAAQEVFNQWRNDVARGEAFHPSAEECWENVMQAQISISNWLDGQLQMKQLSTDTPTTELLDKVNKQFGITDAAAQREVSNFVEQWVYETKAESGHNFVLENNGEVGKIDQRYLTVHNAAMQYANSSSSARSVDNYVPYTDQLKNISDEVRAFIMGMGGIRKHSSNDFRMDYVQDYLMFYADLAAGKWTGHTYTKSVDFCKIFGRTGDRINLSIAFDTKDGKVIMNDQEGANWNDAKALRQAYYNNLGTMAMVTDDLQLSYALNNDWIDMIIPFHASGLPKEVWRNMKAWNDYTSKQLETYLNKTDMVAALKARGVKVPSGAKAAAVAELYHREFGTKFIYNEQGKRQRPHFYPNDTYIKGPNGEMQLVPGHHNDVETYFQLCEEYGVHPRFYGLNVTDTQGNVIPVTEHPNYLKLIKETARTETEQQPIEFNLDQYDDYLGMSPMEFVQERLTQESESGGYENMKVDPAGIIKLFQKDYIGKDRPIGYISESAARKIKGMSKTMAYKEIEANALGLKPADVDKLHETPEAQMLHQRMDEMGLERNSVASETEETTDVSGPIQSWTDGDVADVTKGLNFKDPTGELLNRVFNGSKQYETRSYSDKTGNGKLPQAYLNKPMGIVQTGAGRAQLVGFWELGDGFLADSQWLNEHKAELGNDGTEFEAHEGDQKWVYPIKYAGRTNPTEVTSPGQRERNISSITQQGRSILQTDARTDNGGEHFSLADTEAPLTEAQQKNRDFNDSETETGSPLKTLQGTTIKRYRNTAGKEVAPQVYVHKDYAAQVVPQDALAKAEAVLQEKHPDFTYNTIMYDKKTGNIRFDEAPDFDTAREPIAGHTVTVTPDGATKTGYSDSIWHHKWLWVGNDYTGFDVDASWNWSKQWLNTIRAVDPAVHKFNSSFSQKGIANGTGHGTTNWNEQLDYFGLPHDESSSAERYSVASDENTSAPVAQQYGSADTSINNTKLPSVFSNKWFTKQLKEGGVNIDIGGGKYDNATEYLKDQYRVTNMVFDPFNRSKEHNSSVLSFVTSGQRADTATCANVLNVIQEAEARENVILESAKAIKPDGKAYFLIYEGDGSGRGRTTKTPVRAQDGTIMKDANGKTLYSTSWQEHRKASTYIDEIKKYFNDVKPHGNLIEASNPKENLPEAAWGISPDEAVRYSIASDEDYQSAVDSGDLDTAQQMVDAKAQAEGYTKQAFHGTTHQFWTFARGKEGIHFGDIQQAQDTLEKDQKRNAATVTPLSEVLKNLDKYGEADLNAISQEIEMLWSNPYIQGNFPQTPKNYDPSSPADIRKYAKRIVAKNTGPELKIMAPYLDKDRGRMINAYIKTGNVMTIPVDLGNWSVHRVVDALLAKLDGPDSGVVDMDGAMEYQYKDRETGEIVSDYWYPGEEIEGIELTSDDRVELNRIFGTNNWEQLAKFLHDHNVDSIEYTNMYEGEEDAPSYLLLDPEQVKLADPVTYDDDGNVIPLSERFNSETGDMRFSLSNSEQDMYDLLKADGPQAVENWVNKELEKAQAGREQRSARPLIPTADQVIPVGDVERKVQRNQLDELIKKYGELGKGENPAREISLPKKTGADHFVRRFIQNVEEAPHTSQRTVEMAERAVVTKSDIANYARISDTKANNAADKYYATYGYGKMLKEWNALVDSNQRVTKWDIAKGERLLIEADAQGDTQAVMRLVGDLAAMGTEAGQVVQAMRLLKKMGPVGQLYYFQKAVDRMNKKYAGRIVNGRMAPIVINQKLAEKVMLASTQEEIDKAMETLIKDTAKQLPVSLADKWNAWRYLSMLGNPRTHIRNILGNALFRPLITTKDLLAAAGESIFLKDRSQRTKSASFLLSGGRASAKYRDVVNFANSDFKVMRSQIDGTGKMNTANLLMSKREIFKGPLGKILNTLSEGNSDLLEFEDGMFLKKAYVNALCEYMIAQGLTAEDIATDSKALNQARQYAVLEAQKATYRDYCGLANALNSLRNRDSFASQVLVDGIMPFTKTPTNILRRGIEYSPIGLIKGITYDLAKVKQGDYTAAEAIDHIAAGMTGTMVCMLGAFLASMGIARGADDDDKKKAELERAQGHQEYSLEIGGNSYTVDWVAPLSLPFFVGVEAYKRISNGGAMDFYDVADLMTLIAEPMLSLSMLDGVNQTLTAASYGDNNALQAVLTQVGSSYLQQGLPTLGAQIARTLDPYRRANYVDKNSNMPSWMQTFVQQSMGKIPGVAGEKMAYVDMWGRKQTSGGLGMRALENFVFPWYMKNINENPVEHELLRLSEATGNNDVLPGTLSKSFSSDGKALNLNADQYEKLKITNGRYALETLGELMLTPAYSALDDEMKVAAIKNALKLTSTASKQTVADYKADAWIQRAIDYDNWQDAIMFHTIQSMDSGLTNYQLIECMYWLTPEDQGKLITAQYTPQTNMTDYTQKKYKFILDDDMKARSREIYEQLFWVEYPKLYSSQAWAQADIAGRAELVKKLQTDVGKAARSAYGDELRAQGVTSVYLDDPMEEAEEIAAMINELGYEP